MLPTTRLPGRAICLFRAPRWPEPRSFTTSGRHQGASSGRDGARRRHQFPEATQQFEAVAYTMARTAKPDTKDDIELGPVDVGLEH